MSNQPLADRIRPTTLDEIVGQKHLVGENGIIRKLLNSKRIPNMIRLYFNDMFNLLDLCYELLEENGLKRVMQLQGEYLSSDIIYDERNENASFAWVGKSYIGYEHEDPTKPLPRLSAYLLGDKVYKSEDGAVLTVRPNDLRVTEYLTNNDNLSAELKNVK